MVCGELIVVARNILRDGLRWVIRFPWSVIRKRRMVCGELIWRAGEE